MNLMSSQNPTDKARVFLFLQGPHGPFFYQLARLLQNAGAEAWRVGFNAGDRAFWKQRRSFLPYRGKSEDWPDTFAHLLETKSVTDIVLYGDTRPIHAEAIAIAKARGLKIHVFEEGYLRPYWITYELGGSNGHSPLMQMSLQDMRAAHEADQLDPPVPPSHWGDMRQHVFYGALYHWFVMFWNSGYRHFEPHRALTVSQEFRLYLKRLLLMPVLAAEHRLASLRIKRGRFPYHLALLQLEHDSSFQMHGPFDSQSDFIATVVESFAEGAPAHHHLVLKAHPLEDGRAPLRADIRRCARRHGIGDRVHYVLGGKLAGLLNDARSAVTVNSTSGQQALWRGIPLRVFGASVYDKPELVSHLELTDFFRTPQRGDTQSYRIFRDFLLATSQLPGSYYASRGRRQLLRRVADMMLEGNGPYTLVPRKSAALRQQLRVVG